MYLVDLDGFEDGEHGYAKVVHRPIGYMSVLGTERTISMLNLKVHKMRFEVPALSNRTALACTEDDTRLERVSLDQRFQLVLSRLIHTILAIYSSFLTETNDGLESSS